jgi:epoxyqueuosine reductase QueG
VLKNLIVQIGGKILKFEDKARIIIENECEDYFLGIADLTQAQKHVIEHYGPLFKEYPRAISIGITLPFKFTVDSSDKINYIHSIADQQLYKITAQLSHLLEEEGYNAFSFPKARKSDQTTLSLHLIAANQADLGQIENNVLKTIEAGDGVNWGTVLTDAPLDVINY